MWRNSIAIASLGLVTLVAWMLVRHLRSRRQRVRGLVPQEILSIDIAALPPKSPVDRGVALEIYGVPMVVAVLVLAPAGRGLSLPGKTGMAQFIDNLVPDLMAVLSSHQPLFRRWPEQLSIRGFIHSAFNNLPLPGDRGSGTPWCSVAGKFDSGGQQYLAALVCRAEKSNALGQIEIKQPGQWVDVLRVRRVHRES